MDRQLAIWRREEMLEWDDEFYIQTGKEVPGSPRAMPRLRQDMMSAQSMFSQQFNTQRVLQPHSLFGGVGAMFGGLFG